MVKDENRASELSELLQSLRESTSRGASSSPDVAETLGKLLELVPTIPRNGQQQLSMIDLLQHVIDYIWDLQAVLSSPTPLDDNSSNHSTQRQEKNEDQWEKL